jgi:hypothetical protein
VLLVHKIKGNLIYAAYNFLGLDEHNNSVSCSALLALVFTNVNGLRVYITTYPLVTHGNYHPELNLSFKLIFDSQTTFFNSLAQLWSRGLLLQYCV